MRLPARSILVVLGLSAAGCGQDPTPPPRVADRITLASGDNQVAQVGAPLAAPINFVVGDKDGPLPNVPVSFAIAQEAGFLSAPADTSDALGVVSVTWILGGKLGPQIFSATATGIASATAHATATIGQLAFLVPVSNPSQFVVVGQTVASPPALRATDAFGNAIAGQPISFVDSTGRSTIQDPTGVTDGGGRVAVTSWKIAREPGAYTVQARGPNFTTTNFVAFGTPARVELNAGDNQSANAGTRVTTAPAIRALDDLNQPLPGVTVAFSVSGGQGRLVGNARTITNASGIATAPNWVLGGTPGANELSAEIAGVPVSKFKATGVAAVAAAIARTGPATQAGFVGNFGSGLPSVRITDAAGRPVAGETVTFAVTQGSGTISGATPRSDFNGDAPLGGWRFGTGPQGLSATVGTLPPVLFTATTQTPPASAYRVDVRFIGPPPSATQKEAFDSAAARWSTHILGDLVDIPFTPDDDLSFCGGESLNETIDDLLIFAKIDKIDGAGGILGQAGACYFRDNDSLSVVGIMQFDVDDVVALETSGRFRDVVLHEMGHVFGIGSLWNFKGLITGRGTGDPFFTGPAGRMAFAAAGPATGFAGNAVPVENSGGGGTRDVHWRESILRNELMTGFLNSGGSNPLSALTAASLRDEGYVINDAVADPFTFGAALAAATSTVAVAHTTLITPFVRMIDRAGRVRRIVDLRDGPFKR